MCACWPLIDETLASRNAKLSYVFGAAPAGVGRPRAWITSIQIATEKSSLRKPKVRTIVAARYCPFCGSPVARVALDKQRTTGILRAHYEKALGALASLSIERCAPSANFPLWHGLD